LPKNPQIWATYWIALLALSFLHSEMSEHRDWRKQFIFPWQRACLVLHRATSWCDWVNPVCS
jgi:hypothetical protein